MDGDEADGYDEVIYPVDFRQTGHVTDDEMHRIMVQPLQGGVRLTAIFDSCHSGTALDLPYIYSTQGILKEPNLAKEAGQGLLGVISSYSQGDLGGVANNIMSFFKKATSGEDAYARTLATKTSPADVVMLSGSKDDQTSWVTPPAFPLMDPSLALNSTPTPQPLAFDYFPVPPYDSFEPWPDFRGPYIQSPDVQGPEFHGPNFPGPNFHGP